MGLKESIRQAMPTKRLIEFKVSIDNAEKVMSVYEGYNYRADEDLEWVVKKLEGLEGLFKELYEKKLIFSSIGHYDFGIIAEAIRKYFGVKNENN